MTPPRRSKAILRRWTIYVCDSCGHARLYNDGKLYRPLHGGPTCGCEGQCKPAMREVTVQEVES